MVLIGWVRRFVDKVRKGVKWDRKNWVRLGCEIGRRCLGEVFDYGESREFVIVLFGWFKGN